MELAIIDRSELARHWWAVLLRGIAAFVFGLFILLAPAPSLGLLILAWAIYTVVDGVMLVVSALRRHGASAPWYALLFEGLIGIGVGIFALAYPGLTAIALLLLIAAWSMVTGVLEIVEAIRLRKVIVGEWLLALRGLLTLLFGVALMLFPGPGALALVIWLGAYTIAIGALLIGLSFQLRVGSGENAPRAWAHHH
ncbi:MAG TPA: DUF308 domain-containing protein [Polyangiales bacterium]